MTQYLIRRLLINIPVLIGVTFFIFLFINMAPGDPTAFWVNPEMGTDQQQIELVRQRLGLDQPFAVRYVKWLGQAVQGNLGFRFKNFEPVSSEIQVRLGPTLLLVGTALVFGTALGIFLGAISARRQYSALDFTFTTLAFLSISLPAFFAGLGGLYVFGLKLHWIPIGGMHTAGLENDPVDLIRHLVLPALILSMGYVASMMRYTRSSMLETMRQDYVVTARAKGLKEQVVLFRHIFRNALLPVVTVIGLSLPNLVSGAVFVETVFAWPGLGRLYVDGAMSRDYPLVLGMALVTAVMVLFANLLTDVAYAIVDPRIRYE